jgi:hypothetical protein
MTDSTNSSETKKTRGPKLGSKRDKPNAPRKVHISCVALDNGKLITEHVHCSSALNKTPDFEIVAEAKKLFVAKYGMEPQWMSPITFNRNPQGKIEKVRRSKVPQIDTDNMQLVPGRKAMAIYKDWQCSVRFIEGNDDAVFVTFGKNLKEESKKYPVLCRPMFKSDLTNIVEQS